MDTKLGNGAFGEVYLAKHVENGSLDTKWKNKPLACKIMNKYLISRNPKLRENLKSEISIMRKISHPNVLKIYDI